MSGSNSLPTSRRSGFTLMELLVVLTIFSLVMVTVSGVFLATFRASAKVEVIKELKQNGNYALSSMARALRGASDVVSCTGGTRVDYLDGAGVAGYFECVGGGIASGSASLKLTSSRVSVGSCNFACTLISGQPPVVGLDFRVSQVGAGNTSETGTVRFKTQVTIRAFE